MSKRFQELQSKTELTSDDSLVGVRRLSDGTYQDYKYSASAFAASSASDLKKKITVLQSNIDNDGALSDDYFNDNIIEEIVCAGQTYISGDDFTQLLGKITPIAFSFTDGLKIIAKK